MDDLTHDEWVLLATAVSISTRSHRKVYQEAEADAANRDLTKHYRSMARKDAAWAAEQVNKLTRLDAKLKLMLSEMREAA